MLIENAPTGEDYCLRRGDRELSKPAPRRGVLSTCVSKLCFASKIQNTRELETGEACILGSSWANPITINVGVEARLRIGSHVYINYGTSIVCRIEITIGVRCLIGPGVLIMGEDGHPMNWRTRHAYWPKGKQGRIGAPVMLERGVWIGARATLLTGVTIGQHSVIGAGAVVTRPIPAKVFAAGVPARVIHELPE